MLGPRFALLVFASLLAGASCAVFPDEAVLPIEVQAGAGSGSTSGGTSSLGGQHASAGNAGETDFGGGPIDTAGGGAGPEPMAGAGGVMTMGGTSPMGGAPDPGGGAPGCANPQDAKLLVSSDTWIEQAKPGSTHGNEDQLSLVGGAGAEERVLLVVPVPPRPEGVVLLRATVQLHLVANEDTTLAERELSLHLLTQAYVENRASWTNYSNGASSKWAALGGDFEPLAAAMATLSTSTGSGVLSFDVTAAVEKALGPQAVPLPVIILESGTVPAMPAKLAFGSAEGDANGPSLLVEFCLP